jgi:hypothetical protein
MKCELSLYLGFKLGNKKCTREATKTLKFSWGRYFVCVKHHRAWIRKTANSMLSINENSRKEDKEDYGI